MSRTQQQVVIPHKLDSESGVSKRLNKFLSSFMTYEGTNNVPLLILFDGKSEAFYFLCHLESKVLVSKTDSDAVLDPTESEDYKLNRGIYKDNYAYNLMERDAARGRSFEDLVVEYDPSYRPDKPLKVFGGQHRILAIKEATKKGISTVHGVRVYFGLSTEQRFDIATANNTSIAVSNDLLDRMQEDLLGPDLRTWCQSVGLLSEGLNFADRRSSEGIPTVRIARTIIVNFFLGKGSGDKVLYTPVVSSSGPGIDKNYREVREIINWSDGALKEMGRQFAILHSLQRERVLNRTRDRYIEFANKTMHPAVAGSWAYASGLFQSNPNALSAHYALANSATAPNDPLNAIALVKARFQGVDPDTYRGLGSRISGDELGRMLQVFVLQAKVATKRGISLRLANAAIKTYEANKAQQSAEKALKGI